MAIIELNQLRELINNSIKCLLKENADDLRYAMAGFNHDEQIVKYKKMYHATPMSKISDIKTKGLMPFLPNSDEPNAVYLTPQIDSVVSLCRLLSMNRKDRQDYVILQIDTSGIQLYNDPFAVKEKGAYSKIPISPDRIKILTVVDSVILQSNQNWKLFWNWWFWGQCKKPDFVKQFNLKQYII